MLFQGSCVWSRRLKQEHMQRIKIAFTRGDKEWNSWTPDVNCYEGLGHPGELTDSRHGIHEGQARNRTQGPHMWSSIRGECQRWLLGCGLFIHIGKL